MFVNKLVRTVLSFFLVLAFGTAFAAEPVATSRKGVAIGGHDTFAYHDLKKDPQASAIKGKKSFVVEYKGAEWRFLNEQSAVEFKNNPERYAPMYNGHCANALSLGEGLIPTKGAHWEIFGDKLYLFYAARGRTRWMDGNWEKYKLEADAAWQRLSQ